MDPAYVVPTIFWFGLAYVYTRWWQAPTNHHFDNLIAAGFGIPFIAVAVAQLRSRYIWRNLRPGNRGEHQSEKPKEFICSTAIEFSIGLGIAFLFGCVHTK